VRETARRLGVTLIAYSPLAQGILTGKYHEDPARVRSLPFGRRSRLSPASWGLTPKGLVRTAPLIDELRAVANARGTTAAQVALAWLVTNYGDTVVAIPGASRAEQATAGAAAMDMHLTEDEMARIGEISAEVARR
jgi:aryl-alcohol dehydrogenase-like predicted oxidoreductase